MAIPDVIRLNETRVNRLTSPDNTASPHSITMPAGTCTTQIATTEFVCQAVGRQSVDIEEGEEIYFTKNEETGSTVINSTRPVGTTNILVNRVGNTNVISPFRLLRPEDVLAGDNITVEITPDAQVIISGICCSTPPSGRVKCYESTETTVTLQYLFTHGSSVSLFADNTLVTTFTENSDFGLYTVTHLNPGTNYNFQLRNGTSTSSFLISEQVCATQGASAPPPPPQATATLACYESTTTQISLIYSFSNTDFVEVWRDGNFIFELSAPSGLLTFSDIEPNSSYLIEFRLNNTILASATCSTLPLQVNCEVTVNELQITRDDDDNIIDIFYPQFDYRLTLNVTIPDDEREYWLCPVSTTELNNSVCRVLDSSPLEQVITIETNTMNPAYNLGAVTLDQEEYIVIDFDIVDTYQCFGPPFVASLSIEPGEAPTVDSNNNPIVPTSSDVLLYTTAFAISQVTFSGMPRGTHLMVFENKREVARVGTRWPLIPTWQTDNYIQGKELDWNGSDEQQFRLYPTPCYFPPFT